MTTDQTVQSCVLWLKAVGKSWSTLIWGLFCEEYLLDDFTFSALFFKVAVSACSSDGVPLRPFGFMLAAQSFDTQVINQVPLLGDCFSHMLS